MSLRLRFQDDLETEKERGAMGPLVIVVLEGGIERYENCMSLNQSFIGI